MADELQLRIVTPRRAVVDASVLDVTGPGTLGEFGVLPNHAAFLTSLEIGRFSYRDARGVKTFAIREGFAEVSDNVMTVLSEEAEASSDVDTARARADLAAAQAELDKLSPIEPGWAEADAKRRWAQARLDVAAK